MRGYSIVFSLAALIGGAAWSAASAASYEVRMLNKDASGQAWQFEPAFLKIAPGDTVTFVPADKGHNSETLEATIPEGATPWKGSFNEPVTVTYTVEGVYLYKCLPHSPLGMVGLIQVGDSAPNLEAIKSLNLLGKAKTRVAELVAKVTQ